MARGRRPQDSLPKGWCGTGQSSEPARAGTAGRDGQQRWPAGTASWDSQPGRPAATASRDGQPGRPARAVCRAGRQDTLSTRMKLIEVFTLLLLISKFRASSPVTIVTAFRCPSRLEETQNASALDPVPNRQPLPGDPAPGRHTAVEAPVRGCDSPPGRVSCVVPGC